MTEFRTVLIVDDDDDLRHAVADALETVGHRVLCAANGRDALEVLKAETNRPDVILLDMMMPEMDGWAFRAAQREIAEIASIPVIVFTAFGAPADSAAQIQAAGALEKPVSLERLLEAIRRV